MKILVVIPTYNEKENVGIVVEQILALRGASFSILIVDDNSPDGTGAVADGLASKYVDRFFVIHRPSKQGLGTAYREGFRWGIEHGFEALCEMDADGQHEPAALLSLAGAVESGADVAIGSRRVAGGGSTGWGAHRNLMSGAAMTFTRLVLGLKTHDVTAGFRCYRAAAAAQLLAQPLVSTGYAFQEEATYYCERLGFNIVEVPITFQKRARGTSKLNALEVIRFFSVMLALRWRSYFSKFERTGRK